MESPNKIANWAAKMEQLMKTSINNKSVPDP